jgi:hypothetical protein
VHKEVSVTIRAAFEPVLQLHDAPPGRPFVQVIQMGEPKLLACFKSRHVSAVPVGKAGELVESVHGRWTYLEPSAPPRGELFFETTGLACGTCAMVLPSASSCWIVSTNGRLLRGAWTCDRSPTTSKAIFSGVM